MDGQAYKTVVFSTELGRTAAARAGFETVSLTVHFLNRQVFSG
jgi:hypothetical protein